jgi:glutamyl/glutaminyl-tRNA synthetase
VVVDDAFQQVTRVVRGADLIASTPWQLDLQAALSLPRPIYGHLPLLLESDGSKLSKSSGRYHSITRKWPKGLQPPLRFYPRLRRPIWSAIRSKMLGNGHFRTGAHKRLRVTAGASCPRQATNRQIFFLKL